MPAPAKRWHRNRLSDKQLRAIPREEKRFILADPELRGHYVRVPPKGPRSYVAIARDQYGEQELTTIGTDAELTLEQARDIARERIRRIKAGKDAVEKPKPKPESVESVLSGWLKRHVDPGGLRTEREIRRIIAKYILPNWGDRDFAEIKRSNIAALLDGIEDNHGARTS